jgi:TDG/mug DNA glycosylase family protein
MRTPEGVAPNYKPSPAEVLAARGRNVPDVIAPGLRVLFCGINPGLYSAAVQHHFARPGNRFWKVLHQAGFTSRLLSPCEERELLQRGYGITNLVERSTARADELYLEELIAGAQRLVAKAEQFLPQFVAILGIGVYRKAFASPRAQLGQQEKNADGSTLWLLPNPSGLNGHYQAELLVELFTDLRQAVGSGLHRMDAL